MYLSRSCSKLVLIALIIVFCVSLGGLSFAQVPYFPWKYVTPYPYFPVIPFNYSYTPWVAPVSPYLPPVSLSTPISPFPAISLPRVSNATVITIPAATNTISSTTAPLGTLNLTPSTLVFLILLFTLH